MFAQKFIKLIHSGQEIGLFSLFQNLNLGNALANPKWLLTISWATSCQYQCVWKILSKYSKRFKSYRHFSTFFTNRPASKSSQTLINQRTIGPVSLTWVNFDVSRNLLLLRSFATSFKKSLWSLILYIFFHDFIHAYSPGAGADSPQETKFWCQQKCLVTSFICCKFQKISLKSDFLHWFNTCI